jgi:DNA polymerase-3 subunit delta'
MRLPATIRSRCQRLEFRLPPQPRRWPGWWSKAMPRRKRAKRWRPRAAIRAGRRLAAHDGLALRRDVAGDLERIAAGKLGAVEAAQRGAATNVDLRLRHAAELAASAPRRPA